MSTEDRDTIDSPCLCGKGTISVTQSSPDHPWVKASQVSYDANFNCADCSKKYDIHGGHGGSLPYVVLRSEVEAQNAVRAKAAAASKKLDADPRLQPVKLKMIKMIDQQKSKKAKHEMIGKMGLGGGSYASYLKNPIDGATAVKRARAWNIARTAYYFDLLSPEVLKDINAELDKIKQLENQAVSPKRIKTGATWMSE